MRSILVVDDEAHVTRLVQMHLEDEGYEVVTACDGVDALEKIEAQKFDAVITDYNMPRMDGQQLCKAVRERYAGSELVLFLVTARVDDILREWTEGIPRVQYLEKPLSLRLLSSELSKIFPDAPADETPEQ